MKTLPKWSAAIVAAVALALPAYAGAYTATDKFGRGIAGMVGGVLELPGQMVTESQEHGPSGMPLGFAKGLGMVVAREVTGVYETVTAPIPVPHGYRPVL